MEQVGGNQVRVEGGVEEVGVEPGGVRGNQIGKVGSQVACRGEGGGKLEGGVGLGDRGRGGGGGR